MSLNDSAQPAPRTYDASPDASSSLSLSVLYRGPLSSCNYDCSYCPFGKHDESTDELAADRRALGRFVDWCAAAGASAGGPLSQLRVFFTPWGEALTRRWYWDAFQRLTALDWVGKAAIQTNLSAKLDWLADCDIRKVGLWCTYHPSQVDRRRFLRQVERLEAAGAAYSVGVVGMREDLDEIERLRADLPPQAYLWVNAYKREANYYTPEDVRRLTAVDPHFPTNNTRHASRGKACRCGETVISVDGDGDIRRCHFVPTVLGNIYLAQWQQCLAATPCPNMTCGCHIGYVHMPSLELYRIYGDSVLERRPTAPAGAFAKPANPP